MGTFEQLDTSKTSLRAQSWIVQIQDKLAACGKTQTEWVPSCKTWDRAQKEIVDWAKKQGLKVITRGDRICVGRQELSEQAPTLKPSNKLPLFQSQTKETLGNLIRQMGFRFADD